MQVPELLFLLQVPTFYYRSSYFSLRVIVIQYYHHLYLSYSILTFFSRLFSAYREHFYFTVRIAETLVFLQHSPLTEKKKHDTLLI